MQQTLVAGDSLNFSTTVVGYSAASGWALHFRLLPASGAPIDLSTQPEGATFRCQVAAAATAPWVAGTYTWASWVEKDGEVYTVETGQIVIRQNPRTALAGYDTRTTAAKALESCETALANFKSTGGLVKKYMIAGREMEFQGLADIMKLLSYWRLRVANEQAADAVGAGLANPRVLHARLR